MTPRSLLLLLIPAAACCHGEVVQNVLLDPGFEALSGTAPDSATSPWFTTGENTNDSFRAVTTTAAAVTKDIRNGSQAVVMQYYNDAGAIVQNTPLTVTSGKTYEFSTWALINDHSTNTAIHTAPPIFGLTFWTSPTQNGSYTYRTGLFNNKPTVAGSWEKFTATVNGSNPVFNGAQGHFIQVRIAKTNENSTHRMYFDDAVFGEAGTPPTPTTRPNILFILADDVGWGDINANFPASLASTPNIDSLASTGMRLTDAHSTSAVCAPTRYSVLSGNYPWRGTRAFGSWSFSIGSQFKPGQQSFAQTLRNAGYHTSMFGKVHLGSLVSSLTPNITYPSSFTPNYSQIDLSKPLIGGPKDLGFDYSFTSPSGIQDSPYAFFENDVMVGNQAGLIDWAPGSYPNANGNSIIDSGHAGKGLPNWESNNYGITITGKALEFIDTHLQENTARSLDRPFYLHFCTDAVHVPHSPPNSFYGTPVAGQSPSKHIDMINQLDLMVGKLVSELDSRGILENTIIVFASDNGGLGVSDTLGHDASGGFRANKGSIYEGGHRIPMILRWDGGGIPAGTTYDHPTGIQDLYATLAEMTDIPVPAGQALDSISFKPQLVDGITTPHRSNLLIQSNDSYFFAVREANWKLILDPDTTPTELYDLAADPFETNNLIADPAQRVRINRIQLQFAAIRATDNSPPAYGPVTVLTGITNISGDSVQSDTAVHLLEEQSMRLGTPAPVDLLNPRGMHTAADDDFEWSGEIPAGTVLRSHLVHFNPVTENAAMQGTATHTFPGRILGIQFRDTAGSFATADARFGIPGVIYPGSPGGSSNVFRSSVSEVNDELHVSEDGHTLSLTLRVFSNTNANVDQLRVFTALPPGEDSDGDQLGDAWELLHFGNLGTATGTTPNGSGRTLFDSYRFGRPPSLPLPTGAAIQSADDPRDFWFHFSVANDPTINYSVDLGSDLGNLGPGVEGVDHEKEAIISPSGESIDVWVRPLGSPERFFLRYGVE